MRWEHVAALGIPLLVCGCSALSDTDPGDLEPGAGGMDAGPPEVDGGPGRTDAGGEDSGETDAGRAACDPAPPRCDGDAVVTCIDGVENRLDCAAMDAYCDAGRCVARVCEPGEALVRCNASGSGEEREPCPLGCDPAGPACREESDACDDIPEIPRVTSFDTCMESNDESHVPGGDCPDRLHANGGDRIYRFTLDRPTSVFIDLRDADTVAIDTILYLRRTCDVPESQIECSDDIPCSESDISIGCSDGSRIQVRQSRIETHLEAGTYYVVADHLVYGSGESRFECGNVVLQFEEL